MIESFIKKFKFRHNKELEDIFTHGNCYYFALILKETFNGEIYYMPCMNHFICKIDSSYYDITGKIEPNEHPEKWSTYMNIDKQHYNQVYRDCITFDTRKV